MLVTLIIQVALVLAAARITGAIFRRIGQPQVVGEMVAGIILGPSLLGLIAPSIFQAIFPAPSLGYLNVLSQFGLMLYMFLVGLELDPEALRNRGGVALLTSHASIVAPFFMGAILALFLYPRLADDSVSFTPFALFLGTAMSITAFPVLARILSEHGLVNTKLGSIAIACAAVNDVSAWIILAYLVALVRHTGHATPIWITLLGLTAYVLAMVFAVRPVLRRFETSYVARGCLTSDSVALLLLFVMVSALITEWLGIHLLFGAFLAGAIMPRSPAFSAQIAGKFESVTVLLLLPLFFAYTGLRTQLGLIRGPALWGYWALIMLVAVGGKLGGSALAAKLGGLPWRDAGAIGILMNTRGLMELVLLNIGLDVGVISPVLFSMLALMAVATTLMTSPLIERVYPLRLMRQDSARPAAREQLVG